MSVLFPAERRATSSPVARRKAVERALSQYVPLECEHLTTRDVTELYKAWAPPRLPHFCEACNEYRKTQRKSRGKRYPEEPPY